MLQHAQVVSSEIGVVVTMALQVYCFRETFSLEEFGLNDSGSLHRLIQHAEEASPCTAHGPTLEQLILIPPLLKLLTEILVLLPQSMILCL